MSSVPTVNPAFPSRFVLEDQLLEYECNFIVGSLFVCPGRTRRATLYNSGGPTGAWKGHLICESHLESCEVSHPNEEETVYERPAVLSPEPEPVSDARRPSFPVRFVVDVGDKDLTCTFAGPGPGCLLTRMAVTAWSSVPELDFDYEGHAICSRHLGACSSVLVGEEVVYAAPGRLSPEPGEFTVESQVVSTPTPLGREPLSAAEILVSRAADLPESFSGAEMGSMADLIRRERVAHDEKLHRLALEVYESGREQELCHEGLMGGIESIFGFTPSSKRVFVVAVDGIGDIEDLLDGLDANHDMVESSYSLEVQGADQSKSLSDLARDGLTALRAAEETRVKALAGEQKDWA